MPLKIQEEIIDDDALLPWLGAGRRKDLLLIPSDFFTSGWWLVLSPSEIATYLMLLDVRFQNHFSNLVFVRRSTRLDNYGISDEVYATHRELREFGLLKMRERQGRRRGRIQPKPGEDLFPLEFGVLRKRLQYSATASVMEALGTHSYAPHLAKPERSRRPSSRGMTLEEEMWERVYWEGPPEDPIDPLPDEELLAFPPDTPEWIELLTSIKRRSNEST